MEEAAKVFGKLIEGKQVNVKDFYIISIDKNEISMQGHYSPNLVKKLTKALDINIKLDSAGHLIGRILLEDYTESKEDLVIGLRIILT